MGLSCSMQIFSLSMQTLSCGTWDIFLDQDRTGAPALGAQSFTPGPPGKSLHSVFITIFQVFLLFNNYLMVA